MRFLTKSAIAALCVTAPLTGLSAQMGWTPGSEIVGHSIQVETNGIVNTVYFDAGGGARIVSPGGTVVPASWSASNQLLCLQTGPANQECWPYRTAFEAGRQVTLTSSCQVASRWLPVSTAPMQTPEPSARPERG